MAQVTNSDVRSGNESEAIFKKFRPLPDRGIRLLELLPSSSFKGGAIHCNIIDSHLDHNVQYEALSYCWGTVKPDKQALTIVNYGNHVFRITDSLAHAFRQFRFKDRPRILWADFICIDQKNGDEKGRQVGMMTDVYAQASGVLAWVGPANPEDAAIFDHHDARAKKDTAVEFKRMTAFARFLERDWFSRMWIIQEAAIAKRLILCCGEKAMDWASFRRILTQLLTEHGFMLNTSRTDAGLERIISMVSIRNLVTEHVGVQAKENTDFRLLDIDRIDQHRHLAIVKPGDFTRFLSHSRLFSATDQRDRVYALRGLVLENERGDHPAYETKSTPQVFEEFAQLSMQSNRDLDVLSQAGMHGNSLPSWVPDWSCRFDARALNLEAYRASPVQLSYEASSPGAFIANGHKIDQLVQLLPGFNNHSESHPIHLGSRTHPWTAGPQPSHEKLQLFERTVSDSLNVLQPLKDMIEGGKSGLVTSAPKFVKELVSTAAKIPSAMSDRTKRITFEDEARWRNGALQSTTTRRYQDSLSAYRETLLGGLPIPALGHELNARYRSLMYEIWRERSAENPIVDRGFTSARTLKGKAATGEDPISCPAELKIAYFDGVGKKNSDGPTRTREQFKQTGGSENLPVLTDMKVYKASKGIANLFRGQKRVPKQEPTTEYEKRIAYYENADPWFKNNDSREAKQYLARLYSRQVERMAGHRKFAITRSGYIGWVPECSKEGDELWILEGGKVPFILRLSAEGDGYQLVGEAYIHSLMRGEWFGGKEETMQTRQTIVLV